MLKLKSQRQELLKRKILKHSSPPQSAPYVFDKDLFYMKDSKGQLPPVTAHSVMHHIVHILLQEKRIIGPIRSAFQNGGFIEPYQLMMMDPYTLVTNRKPNGDFLPVPIRLSQQAQLSLVNLQAFQIVHLMGDTDIQLENWMQFTHMDLVQFTIQRSQNA